MGKSFDERFSIAESKTENIFLIDQKEMKAEEEKFATPCLSLSFVARKQEIRGTKYGEFDDTQQRNEARECQVKFHKPVADTGWCKPFSSLLELFPLRSNSS